MRADVEIYRGIEFVRLSCLPSEQQNIIWNSPLAKKTIKILLGSEILTDCLPYNIYLEWYHQYDHTLDQVIHEPFLEVKKLKLVLK